ncbi:SEC-C domain-containing protein [Rhizobium indicum]|uniref:SEC-C domain-containing protein n=1 Tax=Rhizobium indicum TaxID=2583231 RepID=A0ABX6PKK2_9HYPH|nr:SEC-C domain-containing protein [Rhizobium indicum]QKK19184.1 SEC-C domain-containing protein [Rhizobium indicum]
MPAKIRSKKREIGEKELCPCGSGIKYKYCHKKTTKKYFEFDNGDVVAEVAIPQELVNQLEESRKEFKNIFGRSPYKSDPVFWNRAELKENTILKRTKKVMRAAKVPEELIFAYEKTGLIIASDSPATSRAEREEFRSAVKEYFQLKEDNSDPFYIFTYLDSHSIIPF